LPSASASRDVIDQYTSFGWERMCDEMVKLKVKRARAIRTSKA